MTNTLTFRSKMSLWLSGDITHWIVIIAFIALTLWMNTVAYFFGVGYVLLLLWSRRWQWSYIGLSRPVGWPNVLLQAILYSILLLVVIDMIITPITEYYSGQQVDLSSLDGIKGNFISYIIFILFMWVVAAFGEEFVYRGLLVERLGTLFGHTKMALWIAVFISAILFGLAHRYQGISGMVATGFAGFAFGLMFINSKNRLWLTILTHGIYDVIGITLIYLDKEQEVYGLLKNILF